MTVLSFLPFKKKLQGQLEGVRPALPEGQASKRIRRREDFVPNCVDELQDLSFSSFSGDKKKARQADLHDAMLSGRPDEVARISNIMGHAAQQWQREVAVGTMPAMVTNIAN